MRMDAGKFESLRLTFRENGFEGFADEIDQIVLETMQASQFIELMGAPNTDHVEGLRFLRRRWAEILSERLERKQRLRQEIASLSREIGASGIYIDVAVPSLDEVPEESENPPIWQKLDESAVIDLLGYLSSLVKRYLDDPGPDFGSPEAGP